MLPRFRFAPGGHCVRHAPACSVSGFRFAPGGRFYRVPGSSTSHRCYLTPLPRPLGPDTLQLIAVPPQWWSGGTTQVPLPREFPGKGKRESGVNPERPRHCHRQNAGYGHCASSAGRAYPLRRRKPGNLPVSKDVPAFVGKAGAGTHMWTECAPSLTPALIRRRVRFPCH